MRHERSGVLHGLTRVRQFTQDDAHILCMPEQVESEILGVLKFVAEVMAIFGFEYEVELSTRPEKSIGTDAEWELANNALAGALKTWGLPYDICAGEGAFYGPKSTSSSRRLPALAMRHHPVRFHPAGALDLHYIGPMGNATAR
jgi:threonyl-tRNA synthetase